MQHLLRAITGEMTRREIQKRLGLKHREHFYDVYLTPALAAGLIERTAPDKPTSHGQVPGVCSTGQVSGECSVLVIRALVAEGGEPEEGAR